MADTKTASKEAKTGEKVKLTIAQIKADLANGIDRKGIRARYQLNAQGIKQLFQDPRLKGLKVKPAPNFELVEEEEDGADASTNTASSTAKVAPEAAKAEAEKGTW